MIRPPNEKAVAATPTASQNNHHHIYQQQAFSQEKLQRAIDLRNWIHCLKGHSREFILHFVFGRLLPLHAIDADGALLLIMLLDAP